MLLCGFKDISEAFDFSLCGIKLVQSFITRDMIASIKLSMEIVFDVFLANALVTA